MQVLKLLKHNMFPNLGRELGEGKNGQVFELNDKVIKLGIIFDDGFLDIHYNHINYILAYIKRNNPNICCKVYEHNYLDSGYRNTVNGQQKYIIYYYIMEKLFPLTKDEKIALDILLASENEKNIFDLDLDVEKVKLFCENIASSSIKHYDLHFGNIMKDYYNNFKMIDFEDCKISY